MIGYHFLLVSHYVFVQENKEERRDTYNDVFLKLCSVFCCITIINQYSFSLFRDLRVTEARTYNPS